MRLCLPLLLYALCCTACAEPPVVPRASSPLVSIRVEHVPLKVRVVSSHADRARGLGGVTSLAPGEGMLFLYREPRTQRFWMKDCLIALDIAFLDEAGRVLQVDTLEPPAHAGQEPARTRLPRPSAMVLETAAGFFEKHGLGEGSRVVLPESVRRENADP